MYCMLLNIVLLQMTLRPVTCTSPTMMDHTPSSLPDQHQPTHLKQSLIAARQSAAPAGMHGCDSSEHHEAPKQQPSICFPELPAESSTMSVLSVAAMDGTDKPKRREVIPAARRMVLERQVCIHPINQLGIAIPGDAAVINCWPIYLAA